ncbi:GNAT family N-acetyltransferase [Enterococcus hirae]|uniref:GNAT family N-acetyltransferase n=1 Tax=Enterococcus hirae TaxID=1354 RepID=UPI0009BFC266|nr:GNAT family N-acetyltransferase [Enterococcus hirae]EMF0478924.1 GNAT family N-acetyltransferase [Enterococcus hirae]MCA6767113.1 GNAT family N-acetyltransferase [Enterococcus hirae]MDT2651160.1 GNAT family N-acetyltransferase [Enterococcus hirae]MDV7772900.1 GNAT family N-acetyltransferase [Enterococcus hirae]OQO43084.1 hypothetical protein BH737_14070 [Enterococcus hirae]
MYNINVLKWDTEFFGKKSYRVILQDEQKQKEWEEIQEKIKDENGEFITFINSNNRPLNNYNLSNLESCFLVDVNVQFTKKIRSFNTNVDNDFLIKKLSEFNQFNFYLDGLFTQTRFYNDPNIKKEDADNIYKKWVENAFLNKNKNILVVEDKLEKQIGFCIYSKANDEIVIELIGVDQTYRNKGIASKMISYIESNYREEELIVGTQISNIRAMNLYFKCGFKIQKVSSIYHYWRQNNE